MVQTKSKVDVVFSPSLQAMIPTPNGLRPIMGSLIIYRRTDPKTKRLSVFNGVIKYATRNEVILNVHHRVPEEDEQVITTFNGPWDFAPDLGTTVELILGLRCQQLKESIDPRTPGLSLVLQCVKKPGHTGGHHFENPGNEPIGKGKK